MMSFADFCLAFEEHVRRTQPNTQLEATGVGTFDFTDENGTRMSISLQNAYRFYEAAPDHIASLFDRVLAMVRPAGKILPDQLVAMVRDSSVFQGDTAITQDLGPGLVLAVAADLGDHFIFPTADTLEASGIERADAVNHALRNVDKFVGDVSANLHPTGFRMFGSSNDISSSLILSEKFLDFIRGESVGEPVFIVVARNFLVIGDSANSDGVTTMCTLAKSTDPGPHPISSEAIVNRDGKWMLFVHPEVRAN